MVEVALFVDRGQPVEFLRVARRAERGEGKHLGLPAREESRSVRARAEIDLGRERADLFRIAPVGALVGLQDVRAHFGAVQVVESLAQIGLGHVGVVFKPRQHFAFDGVEDRLPLGFVELVAEGLGQPLADFLRNGFADFIGQDEVDVIALGFARLGGHFFLRVDQRLDRAVRLLEGFHHQMFRHFVRARFDHQDRVARGGHPQVESPSAGFPRRSG